MCKLTILKMTPKQITIPYTIAMIIMAVALSREHSNIEKRLVQHELVTAQATVVASVIVPTPELHIIDDTFTDEVKYWQSKIWQWAQEYSIDPNIIATIMQIESCGDPNAVSYAGAQGLFQVMPFHFDAGEDMQDPDTNMARSALFMNQMIDMADGDVYLAFAAYNGGPSIFNKAYGNWANETQRYYQWAKGIYNNVQASQTISNWLDAGGNGLCNQAAARLGIN